MKLRTVLCAALALSLASSAFAQKQLAVGDPAPGLDIEKWVKKDPVTIETGKVYVVEFWATWCGPCKRSIPHLSSLQKEYGDKGLTIIGVSTETVDVVQKFVKTQGDKMNYTVAVDRSQGTNRAWFSAAGLSGIPAAFIVDRQGKIAYIGNPLQEDFEPSLKKIIAGRFDPKLEAMAKPVIEQARQQRKVRNWRMATLHYDQVVELDAKVFATIGLEKFDMILRDMNDRQQAYNYARNDLLNRHFASDAEALQLLAERIVADPKIDPEKRDKDLALEAAETAQRLVGEDDSNALAVVALVRFHRGEVDQAIELQRQAWFNAPPKRKAEFQRTLKVYQESAHRASLSNSTASKR